MFDSANLDHIVDKATWKQEEPALREALLAAQFELGQRRKFPVLILIGGVEGAGKGETVNLLNEWMDPRFIHTFAFGDPTDEERQRPPMWRFWQSLPPKGRIGVFFGAWHSQPIVDRALGRISEDQLESNIAEALRFERMLADEGVLILKFWFHLTRKQQKKRLTALSEDPRAAWRVTDQEWDYHARYDDFLPVAERFIRRTSTGDAPWFVVPGSDDRYRSLFVGKTILASLQERLGQDAAAKPVDRTPALPGPVDGRNVINALVLDQPMEKDVYTEQLDELQGRLALLSRHPKFAKAGLVLVFEGNDAAGKGGAIRRVTQALDARLYTGVSIAAPTEEERAQPYLWRFWRRLPRRGRVVLFDRSWYGRLLVERVEGFCAESDWMRGYSEICDFETQLVEHGYIVVKVWLAISSEEQLARFKAREATAFKKFKITDEDWRNRNNWDAYERAVCDMIDRTSTTIAPWTLIEANNKYHARLKVLRTIVEAVEKRLGVGPKVTKRRKKG